MMYIFSTNGTQSSCPVCGFKISDLYSTQKMGCSFCYLFLDKESEIILKNLQDKNVKHRGRKPRNPNKLLHQFFEYAITQEKETGDSNSKDCDALLKILNDYF